MTLFRNINNGKTYLIEHIIIAMCVCGRCGIGYFAFRVYDNETEKIEINPSEVGAAFIPVSEI